MSKKVLASGGKAGALEMVAASPIAPGLLALATPIDSLNPDPANARRHDRKNIDAIKASLGRWGQRLPLIVQRNGMIVRAGNGRLEAMKELGWTEAACLVVDDSDIEAVSFAIADNRTAELAEWDDDALAALLNSLPDAERLLTGFDDADLAALGDPVEVVEDEAPEPPADPITKAGDLWLLGSHRLLCGDSAIKDDVERLMTGARASCVFQDPPYGVSIGAKNRFLNSVQKAGRCLENITDDDMGPEELKSSLLPSFTNTRELVMADDCTLFVTAPQGGELGMMMMMMREAGLPVRHVLIWKKSAPTFSMGRLDYDYAHEPILLTWGKRHKRPMLGKHKTSVWEVDKPRASAEHPTMKPVELYANAYQNNSDAGDAVADMFAGSGTAFIASEQVGRRCFGMEISPAYCDVIVQRWENLTGKKATRE